MGSVLSLLQAHSPGKDRRRSSGRTSRRSSRVFVSILDDFTHAGQSIDMSKPFTPEERAKICARCQTFSPPVLDSDDRFVIRLPSNQNQASAPGLKCVKRVVIKRRASLSMAPNHSGPDRAVIRRRGSDSMYHVEPHQLEDLRQRHETRQ